MVPLYPILSMDFKMLLAHISVSITCPPNANNELGLLTFNTPAPIDITMFREIPALAR